MDCGPASLKIISRYYGKSFSMSYLRELCNVDREGVSLLGIGKACDKLNLKSCWGPVAAQAGMDWLNGFIFDAGYSGGQSGG